MNANEARVFEAETGCESNALPKPIVLLPHGNLIRSDSKFQHRVLSLRHLFQQRANVVPGCRLAFEGHRGLVHHQAAEFALGALRFAAAYGGRWLGLHQLVTDLHATRVLGEG